MSLLNNAGIGKKVMIEKWLQKMHIENYMVNQDMTIDVKGGVDISCHYLHKLPDYIQFNVVEGSFFCNNNMLHSLEGCPKEITGTFDCSYNRLETLENGPIYVGGNYNCSCNNLLTLKNCPDIIYGYFDCSYNDLENKKYAPYRVCGESYYDCNPFKSRVQNKKQYN